MAKYQASNQTLLTLALVLVLLVVGGTFLILQELKELNTANRVDGAGGKVYLYVTEPPKPAAVGGQVNLVVVVPTEDAAG